MPQDYESRFGPRELRQLADLIERGEAQLRRFDQEIDVDVDRFSIFDDKRRRGPAAGCSTLRLEFALLRRFQLDEEPTLTPAGRRALQRVEPRTVAPVDREAERVKSERVERERIAAAVAALSASNAKQLAAVKAEIARRQREAVELLVAIMLVCARALFETVDDTTKRYSMLEL